MLASATSSSRRAKCVTNKQSGKRSCCAHRGIWFNKSRDTDDGQLVFSHGQRFPTRTHTSLRRVQLDRRYKACFVSRMGVIIYPVNNISISQRENAAQRQMTTLSHAVSMPNAVTTNFEAYFR